MASSSPSPLTLDPQKVTPAMRESLEKLRASLLCPMGERTPHIFVEPTTLACAHTFCKGCIETYTCNAWNCPLPGCGMPVTARGGRQGSYLKINPQISTVVSSFETICKTLNDAPNEWWNIPKPDKLKEEEEEEVIDFQANAAESPKASQNENDDDSSFGNLDDYHSPRAYQESQQSSRTQDSQKTVPFSVPDPPSPESSSLQSSEEDDKENVNSMNRSCLLPSQSPGVSPIAHAFSQPEEAPSCNQDSPTLSETNSPNQQCSSPKNVEATQKTPECSSPNVNESANKVPNPSLPVVTTKPRILLASRLSTKDRTAVQTCVQEGRLELVSDSLEDEIHVESRDAKNNLLARLRDGNTYAICGNAEMETGDGFLVGRTFGYLLAVACGLPVLYIRHITEALEHNSTLSAPTEGKNLVIGDTESTQWMAPQRALENKATDRVGTTLLQGYTIWLHGDFDTVPSSHRAAPSRKRARTSGSGTSSLYSKARLQCLLELCGAHVHQLEEFDDGELPSDDSSKAAVLLRPNPHARDWRSALKFISNHPKLVAAPIICCNWLLDSIGNFEAVELADYTQDAFKQRTK